MGCEKSSSRHFIRSSNGKRITLRETNGSGQGWWQWADYHGVMCSCLRVPWMGLFLSRKDEEVRCWSTTHLCSHSTSIFGALRQFKKPGNVPKLLSSALLLGISSPFQLISLGWVQVLQSPHGTSKWALPVPAHSHRTDRELSSPSSLLISSLTKACKPVPKIRGREWGKKKEGEGGNGISIWCILEIFELFSIDFFLPSRAGRGETCAVKQVNWWIVSMTMEGADSWANRKKAPPGDF